MTDTDTQLGIPDQPRLGEQLRRTLETGNHPAFLDLLADKLPGSPGDLTRKNVLSSLRVYLRWTADERRSVLNAVDSDARAYLTHLLLKHDGAPSSIHNHLTRVRTLYRVLLALGVHPGPNPFLNLKLPTNRPEEHRDFYSPAEVQRLLAQTDAAGQALILLGAHGGLTGPEVVHLRWEHFDAQQGQLQVAQRTLRLDEPLHPALRVYGASQGHGDLFAAQGPIFSYSTDHQLRAFLFNVCIRANVSYRGWRALRNAAGLRLLELTGDPKQVAETLGLTTLKATEPWQKLSAAAETQRAGSPETP
ncbi:tyrosine-type recombinase/integrase [Deinococcus ruber]|uniref:Core-binding (CB) domain-containing protein n=1 Tax=Deinococcus ruber TaxID=1848197 RepID=A0A918CCW4_9DEIO|nr:site-specific integrase [Deinococcus ruber]GGR18797.1 hypothetical protein GCM10008957_34300 [Deinococcus ruber]